MFFKEKWNGQNFACVIDGFKASSKRNCENERRKHNSGRDMGENERVSQPHLRSSFLELRRLHFSSSVQETAGHTSLGKWELDLSYFCSRENEIWLTRMGIKNAKREQGQDLEAIVVYPLPSYTSQLTKREHLSVMVNFIPGAFGLKIGRR